MFKGKVVFYKNVDGHIEKVEKEFDDQETYQKFLAANRPAFQIPRIPVPARNGRGGWDMGRYLDAIVNNAVAHKLGCCDDSCEEECLPELEGIDLATYEKTRQKLEYDKTHKEEKRRKLEATLEKLESYKKTFSEEGEDEMEKRVSEDIKKIKEELGKIEKGKLSPKK